MGMIEERGKYGPMEEMNITEVAISEIDDFPNHPYSVKDDEDMRLLIESISERGVITPVIIRKKEDGRYEMISGHRRKHACEKLGLKKIKADIIDVDRDEAVIIMVDSNAQRSEISPCEKGRAYKMKLEAMKRQGMRTDLTSSPVGIKLEGKQTLDVIGEKDGDSRNQVYRFIRLTELVPELQEYVDDGSMKMRPAVELSYLDEETQRDVVDRITETEAFPSHDQAIRIRKAYEEGNADYECIRKIMDEEKPNQKPVYRFSSEKLQEYIPSEYTPRMAEDFVLKALYFYTKYLTKQKEQSR